MTVCYFWKYNKRTLMSQSNSSVHCSEHRYRYALLLMPRTTSFTTLSQPITFSTSSHAPDVWASIFLNSKRRTMRVSSSSFSVSVAATDTMEEQVDCIEEIDAKLGRNEMMLEYPSKSGEPASKSCCWAMSPSAHCAPASDARSLVSIAFRFCYPGSTTGPGGSNLG